MHRRFTAICVVGLLVLGGCAASDPMERPEKPETLTNQTVETFAESTEETVLYNERLSSNPTENNLACRGITGTESETGYLVFVQCTGGIQFQGGEHEDVATWSLYYVNDDATKRSSVRDADVRSMESENGNSYPHSGFQIVNFDSTTHEINVALAPDGPESASNATLSYRLDSNESVIQNDIPVETGTKISMDVRTSTDSETFTYAFEKPATRFGHGIVVGVLPDGQVVLARLPPKID